MTLAEVTGFAKSSKFQTQLSAIIVNVKMDTQAYIAKFRPALEILVWTTENVLLKRVSTHANAIMVILVKIAKFHPAQLSPVKMVPSAQAWYEKFIKKLCKKMKNLNVDKLSHSHLLTAVRC